MKDDVQYFPPGPEFKLAREAAAMKAYSQDQTQPAVTASRVNICQAIAESGCLGRLTLACRC